MAKIKFKKLVEGCTLSLLVRDIESDRKNIRIFIKNPENFETVVQCDEDISNMLRNNTFTIKELLECHYNHKEKMIELNNTIEDEPSDAMVIRHEDIW